MNWQVVSRNLERQNDNSSSVRVERFDEVGVCIKDGILGSLYLLSVSCPALDTYNQSEHSVDCVNQSENSNICGVNQSEHSIICGVNQ